MFITYKEVVNKYDSITKIQVKVFKKISGEIKPVEGGWQYFPKGSKNGGEVMTTVNKVKKSLEEL